MKFDWKSWSNSIPPNGNVATRKLAARTDQWDGAERRQRPTYDDRQHGGGQFPGNGAQAAAGVETRRPFGDGVAGVVAASPAARAARRRRRRRRLLQNTLPKISKSNPSFQQHRFSHRCQPSN